MFSYELEDLVHSAIRIMSAWFTVELVLATAQDHQDTDDDCKGDCCIWIRDNLVLTKSLLDTLKFMNRENTIAFLLEV